MKRSSLGLALTLSLSCVVSAPVAAQEDPWDLEWEQIRTASVRVFFEAGTTIVPSRLRELEAAVQRIADELGLDEEARQSLREDPIDYLYLRNPSSLKWFGVGDVTGLALVGERRILAAGLPHEHEIVHVLSHVAISPAPEQNQPWIQEGLASYLGGHLGESPRAVLARGDDALDRYPGLISRILTVSGFRESSIPAADCYAASARFIQYLDEARGGRGRILELMRLLSGADEEVLQRPASIVETQLEGVYDTTFAELMDDFEAWRARLPVAGVELVAPPQRSADFVLTDADHQVQWWLEDTGWVVVATPRGNRISLALAWGSPVPDSGALTSPAAYAGYELVLDESGGHLIDHRSQVVVLRWFDPGTQRGVSGAVAWFFPAEALGSVQGPARASQVRLWSQPRFQVE